MDILALNYVVDTGLKIIIIKDVNQIIQLNKPIK